MAPVDALPHLLTRVRKAMSQHEARDFGLPLLTVRLLFRDPAGTASLTLTLPSPPSTTARPAERMDLSWEIPVQAFQVGVPFADATKLAIPRALVEELQYRLPAADDAARQPLWLKLARPFGVLAAAPWEGVLVEALRRPVLRLMEFPKRPAERSDRLECALVVDPDADDCPTDVLRRVEVVARASLEASTRSPARVHIFPNSDFFGHIRDHAFGDGVEVHDPCAWATSEGKSDGDRDRSGRPSGANAWSDWISACMANRGLDVVHLICRAQQSDGVAELIVSNSPAPKRKPAALMAIGQEDLSLLVSRAGAWATTFTPASNDQDRDLALFADGFAHRRPGSISFQALGKQAHERSLAAAFSLLLGAGAGDAPMLNGGFVYCHPDLVHDAGEDEDSGLFALLQSHAQLVARSLPTVVAGRFQTQDSEGSSGTEQPVPPSWVSATQRFLESAVLDELRRSASDVLLSKSRPERSPSMPNTVVQSTLSDIQHIVSSYLKQSGK